MIYIILLSWGATCFGLFAESAGTATCTFPSVRQDEEATLTCSFKDVNMTNANAITVYADGLQISGPQTDGVLSVLRFRKSNNTEWQKITLNTNFLLKNGTVVRVNDNTWNVLVTIRKATAEYEGEYSCQLAGTPNPQSCHFFLDRVKVDYLNGSSVLLYLELQNASANSSKQQLIQRVEVGLQDAGENLMNSTLNPPHTSYTVPGLENNTKYEMIIYQGPAQVPVTRTVCIPTVQSLTTSDVNTSRVRVDWKPSVCDNSIVNHAYRICYKKVVSGDNNCTDSEKPFTFINDPDTGAVYEISVQVMIDGKIIGGVTTHKAVLKEALDEDSGGLGVEAIAVIVVLVVLLVTAVVAYLIYYFTCRSKKPKNKEETPDQLDIVLKPVRGDAHEREQLLKETEAKPEQKSYKDLEKDMQAKVEEIDQLNQKVQETEAEPELKSYEDLEKDMQAKVEEIDQLNQKVQDMEQELQEKRDKCHELEAEMKVKDAKIRSLEQEKQVADEELQALRRKVDDLTQDINRLKKEKQDADEELQAFTQDINRLKKEMQVTEQKLNESQHGLQANMIEIKTLEEQKQKVNEELQSLGERFEKLTMEMKNKENRITSLEQEFQHEQEEANRKCTKLQRVIKRKNGEIDRQKNEKKEQDRKLAEANRNVMKLTASEAKYQERSAQLARSLKQEQDRKLAEANRNVMKLTASEAKFQERCAQLTRSSKQVEQTPRHTDEEDDEGIGL